MSTYYGKYDIMKTYQVDTMVNYKTNFSRLKSQSQVIMKYINISECKTGAICSKAKSSYLTLGLKQIFIYQDNKIKMGTFLGKRTFAIMNDGFRVQHHAMEFDKTMFIGISKSFSNFEIALSYVYQEATELPSQTKDVEVRNAIFSLRYKY